VKKHGQEKRRVWRKLHLALDAGTPGVICADLSLKNVTDAEAFPGLIRQPHRKVKVASADGAYDKNFAMTSFGEKNQVSYPAANPGGLANRLESAPQLMYLTLIICRLLLSVLPLLV